MNKMEPKKYLLIHTHRFGTSHAIFLAEGFNPLKIKNNKQIKALTKICGLDYEPEREEELLMFEADTDVVMITKADLKG